MRAMAVVDYGSPLQLLDLPEPRPREGQVLVRVLTCGVCYSDVKTSRGHMPFSKDLRLPHVPGHEICGEVVEAGPETGFEKGQKVVVYNYWSCGRCAHCRMGDENLCLNLQGWVGFISHGGFEEYLAVPADRLLSLPEGVSPEAAATVSCALGTAYRAVTTRGRVRAGESLLVLGAGGVGLQAIQVAKAAGARVLAVDIDERKLDVAREMGAEAVALAGEAADALVADFTAGVGVDVVIEAAGHPQALDQSARWVRRGGRVVGVGYRVGEKAPVPSEVFVLHEIEYIGSRYVQRHELARALHLVAAGKIRAVVDSVLPLEQANEALERLERGEVVGRVVLKVAD